MSVLDFLSPVAADADVLARSPMESLAVDAGARLEARDGWNVAVSYPAASFGESVSWCDTSHLPKLQLQGSLDESLPFGTAYAVWTGIGAAGSIIVGMLVFSESADPVRILCLTLIVAGMVGLKLNSPV